LSKIGFDFDAGEHPLPDCIRQAGVPLLMDKNGFWTRMSLWVDSGGFLDYKTGEILGCPGFTHFPQGG